MKFIIHGIIFNDSHTFYHILSGSEQEGLCYYAHSWGIKTRQFVKNWIPNSKLFLDIFPTTQLEFITLSNLCSWRFRGTTCISVISFFSNCCCWKSKKAFWTLYVSWIWFEAILCWRHDDRQTFFMNGCTNKFISSFNPGITPKRMVTFSMLGMLEELKPIYIQNWMLTREVVALIFKIVPDLAIVINISIIDTALLCLLCRNSHFSKKSGRNRNYFMI